ncbi:allatostatin-A receptor-like [Limulus polyphemus]|uniref:Allatostatin-A receptor-like n=1 Tax=Limulus polyphemus TaxID=6850 RepID=A0ABM1T7Q3_LIMPO|nr:allatostatin-A receptor-like [Limulus polyphemus]XP_022251909.1 allatostatin-A receptor-like [Limulus polyphemus]XP_022251910.1 allatostatin-A receptor-like [Limulus polyphemus]
MDIEIDVQNNNSPKEIQPESMSSSFPIFLNHTLQDTYNNMSNLSFLGNDSREEDIDYFQAEEMERILSVLIPILFGAIVVIGLIGNSFVVIVVWFNHQMRSTTNLLIINLAIADLLFIIFCVPFTGWDYSLPYWPFGDIWCRIVQYLVFVCAYASIYTLVLMSLDRFMAVVHPITSMSIRTERNAYIAIAITWSCILIACVPLLEAHGLMNYMYRQMEHSTCGFLAMKGYNYAAFQISFFLSSYVIPLVLIFVLYMLMLKRLWFHVTPGGKISAESQKSKKRVTRMVVVVVLIFAICWCPIQIVLVLKSLDKYEHNTSTIAFQVSSHILAYMNSCVNPILYAFLSENFRKAFHKIISCNPRQKRPYRQPFERNERETVGTYTSKSTRLNNEIL